MLTKKEVAEKKRIDNAVRRGKATRQQILRGMELLRKRSRRATEA